MDCKVMIKCPTCFQEIPEPDKTGFIAGDVKTSACDVCGKDYKWAVFNVPTIFVRPDYSFVEEG